MEEKYNDIERSIIEKYNSKIKRAAFALVAPAIINCFLSVNAGEFIDKYTDVPFKIYKKLGYSDRKRYHETIFCLSILSIVSITSLNVYLMKLIYERKRDEEIEEIKEGELEAKIKDE